MKINFVLTTVSFVLILLSFSCSDDDGPNSDFLEGEWQWEYSQGSWAGLTFSPDSVGYNKSMIFKDDIFQEFINDSLIFEFAYTLEVDDNRFDSTEYKLQFSNGGGYQIFIERNKLGLQEWCADCYYHRYTRK